MDKKRLVSLEKISLNPETTKNTEAQTQEWLDAERKKLENRSFEQDIKLRKEYAHKVYWLILGFVVGVFIVLLLSGFDFICFSLSTSVLITLLSTMTTSVIGLFVIVMKYLFR